LHRTKTLKQSISDFKMTSRKDSISVVLPPYIVSTNKTIEKSKKHEADDIFENVPILRPISHSKLNNRILSARLPKDKGFINKLRPNTASMNRIENKILKNTNRPVTAINKPSNIINININFFNFDEQVKPTPVKDLIYMNTNTKSDDFFKDIKNRPQTGKFRNSILSAIKSDGFVFKEIIKALENEKENKKLTINDLTKI
jgi:hypothetical protein